MEAKKTAKETLELLQTASGGTSLEAAATLLVLAEALQDLREEVSGVVLGLENIGASLDKLQYLDKLYNLQGIDARLAKLDYLQGIRKDLGTIADVLLEKERSGD